MSLQKQIPYLVPTTGPSGDFVLQQIENPEWPTLSDFIHTHSITRPLLLVSPDQFLDVFFAMACNTASVPATTGNPYNLPWTVHTMQYISVDCLIIDNYMMTIVLDHRHLMSLSGLRYIIVIGRITDVQRTQITGILPGIHIAEMDSPLAEYEQTK